METAEGRAQKKPIVIEFIRTSLAISLAKDAWKKLPQWLRDAYEKGDVIFTPECVHIKTLEGDHRADPNDMIVRGIKGELYPCKPDIFEASYDVQYKLEGSTMRAYEVRYITEHVITILAESIEDAQVRAKCAPADDWNEVSSSMTSARSHMP